jgi:hypothetical protein
MLYVDVDWKRKLFPFNVTLDNGKKVPTTGKAYKSNLKSLSKNIFLTKIESSLTDFRHFLDFTLPLSSYQVFFSSVVINVFFLDYLTKIVKKTLIMSCHGKK